MTEAEPEPEPDSESDTDTDTDTETETETDTESDPESDFRIRIRLRLRLRLRLPRSQFGGSERGRGQREPRRKPSFAVVHGGGLERGSANGAARRCRLGVRAGGRHRSGRGVARSRAGYAVRARCTTVSVDGVDPRRNSVCATTTRSRSSRVSKIRPRTHACSRRVGAIALDTSLSVTGVSVVDVQYVG